MMLLNIIRLSLIRMETIKPIFTYRADMDGTRGSSLLYFYGI
jgi:hypothetical protein